MNPNADFVFPLLMILQLCLGLTLAAHAAPEPLQPADVQPLIELASNHEAWPGTPFLSAPPSAESYMPFGPRSLDQLRTALEQRELEQVLMVPEERGNYSRDNAMGLLKILAHHAATNRPTPTPSSLLSRTRGTLFDEKRPLYRTALLEWNTRPKHQRDLLSSAGWTPKQWRRLPLPKRRGVLLDALWQELAPTAPYGGALHVNQRASALQSMHELFTGAEFEREMTVLKAARRASERIQAIRRALDSNSETHATLNALIDGKDERATRDEVDRIFDEMRLGESAPAPAGLTKEQRAALTAGMEAALRARLEGDPLAPQVAARTAHSGLPPIVILIDPGVATHYTWIEWNRLHLGEAPLAKTLADLGHPPDETLNIPKAAGDLADLHAPLFIEAGASYRQKAWVRARAQQLGASLNGGLDNLTARWTLRAEYELYLRNNPRTRALVAQLLRKKNPLGLLIGLNDRASLAHSELIHPSLEGAVAMSLPAALDDAGIATMRFLSDYVRFIHEETARLKRLLKESARR